MVTCWPLSSDEPHLALPPPSSALTPHPGLGLPTISPGALRALKPSGLGLGAGREGLPGGDEGG